MLLNKCIYCQNFLYFCVDNEGNIKLNECAKDFQIAENSTYEFGKVHPEGGCFVECSDFKEDED